MINKIKRYFQGNKKKQNLLQIYTMLREGVLFVQLLKKDILKNYNRKQRKEFWYNLYNDERFNEGVLKQVFENYEAIIKKIKDTTTKSIKLGFITISIDLPIEQPKDTLLEEAIKENETKQKKEENE